MKFILYEICSLMGCDAVWVVSSALVAMKEPVASCVQDIVSRGGGGSCLHLQVPAY
jgi:hypothetical protein